MTYAELVQKISDYTEVDSNVLTTTIVVLEITNFYLMQYLQKVS